MDRHGRVTSYTHRERIFSYEYFTSDCMTAGQHVQSTEGAINLSPYGSWRLDATKIAESLGENVDVRTVDSVIIEFKVSYVAALNNDGEAFPRTTMPATRLA